MHAQVYQPSALITSQCGRRSGEKLTLLCLAVKTLGFFLAQLVSSPNPGEPYPKSSAQFPKFQKELCTSSSWLGLALKSLPYRSPLTAWHPPNCITPHSDSMPGNCWDIMPSS